MAEVIRLNRYALFLLLAFLVLPFGQVRAQRRTVKILGVSVEGNRTTEAEIIRTSSGLYPGRSITGDDIQKAIRQLWAMDLFSDIEILLDREVSEGAYLTIRVKEYPRLESYTVEGNKKLKKKEVEDALDLYRGQVVSPRRLKRAQVKLEKLYRDKGFLLATVRMDTARATESTVHLRVTIEEGRKVQIKKIDFVGNQTFSDAKLRKQMKGTKEDRWWRGADFDRKKYEEDLEKVLEFYRNEGFRDAEIVSDTLWYSEDRSGLFITVTVHEGRRYRFGKITWEGNRIFPTQLLEAQLGFKQGDVYSAEKLHKAVFEKIGGLYYDSGYIFANITPRETPADSDVVDVHFLINEGEPVHVRKIHIAGNTKTKDKVIRRELRIRPGEVFSRDALIRSQREVFMLNYFSNVVPEVKTVDNENVDLVIKVEEKSTDTANMSAGYSERDKIIGMIGVSMNNLFGNGQRLSFDWNFGRFYRSFQISFTEPWLFDTPTLAGFSIYDLKRDPYYVPYRQRSQGASVRVGRRFRWPDIYFRGDWIYRIDRTELSDFSQSIIELNPNGIVTQEWPLVTSSVTHILSRNSLDRPEFPTRGSEMSLSVEYAGGPLGGNVSFLKYIFSSDWFVPSFLNLVFYSSFQAGYIQTLGRRGLPYLEYFFMGGNGMSQAIPLRGYEDPLATYSAQEGGRAMMKYTFELRVPIAPNPTIFALAFAEAGNTWPTLASVDPYRLRRSVGIGARMFMPMIGVIGFDYGYGFDVDPVTGVRSGWKPQFVFGRAF
ncbi:MAG: outer membrane protein assembly factor BamA [candidate division KSB1 bacterium]|nr:outer membrane protein assembly factor BamA [candidate division KSB1 bacterium]